MIYDLHMKPSILDKAEYLFLMYPERKRTSALLFTANACFEITNFIYESLDDVNDVGRG